MCLIHVGARLCVLVFIYCYEKKFLVFQDPSSLYPLSSQIPRVTSRDFISVPFSSPSYPHSLEASGLMEELNQRRWGKAGAELHRFVLHNEKTNGT